MDGLVCFILLCLRDFEFLNATRRDWNLPQKRESFFSVSPFASEEKTGEVKEGSAKNVLLLFIFFNRLLLLLVSISLSGLLQKNFTIANIYNFVAPSIHFFLKLVAMFTGILLWDRVPTAGSWSELLAMMFVFLLLFCFVFLDLTRYSKNNCNLFLICFAKNLQNINGKVESAPVICSLESNHEQYPGLSQHSSLAGLNDL